VLGIARGLKVHRMQRANHALNAPRLTSGLPVAGEISSSTRSSAALLAWAVRIERALDRPAF
jgi:hypothetical protein